MKLSQPENFETIANSMGIALYQRFSLTEASLFLRCPESEIKELIESGKINTIKISAKNFQFLGYQLLEYILDNVTNNRPPSQPTKSVDRIIRAGEVESMVGLSRTTLWRYERRGEFPKRVSLGASSVGWKLNQVQAWIDERQ